ncbi:gamma-glutamylcyclotransferase family protein [Streptomyces ipomoeae]|uniref:gamma-glutamylcyclotransferase family protein n=1 Tax=Streptomyces ipomoeae TaxID=103232 RepID=UPI0011466BB6|nr:gamma-glutamylcyclotransferase family protein [Streptomyces ipomoeae]MDX2939662.1 gamma-glutamylcyclotransferase [Streptomyces ipomoeae]TQE23478.1 gamma-glutamylcyclotransferase [Streptomyces ipomoeae]TQE38090.1 gamma-glutamylcyclotransferase [Streptomyces ipomoeae]
MREQVLPFFVYGTLRPGEPNHDVFLRGRTSAEVPARMRGVVLYDGPGYPYAVEHSGRSEAGGAEAGPGGGEAVVSGELVTARAEEYEELLRALDRLEDYAPGDPANLYERVERTAVLSDGTPVRAWVYIAAPAVAVRLRAGGKLIGGGDWRARV